MVGSVLADSAFLLSLLQQRLRSVPRNNPGTAFPWFVFVSWTSACLHFRFR